MAKRRRYARHVAKVYEHACGGVLFVPQCLDDFHRLWDIAMEGEPRWSEDYPTSAFRTSQSEVRSANESEGILQINTRPENISMELYELLRGTWNQRSQYGKAVVNSGESYIYEDGAWKDWADKHAEGNFQFDANGCDVDNFSIKAYAPAVCEPNLCLHRGRWRHLDEGLLRGAGLRL